MNLKPEYTAHQMNGIVSEVISEVEVLEEMVQQEKFSELREQMQVINQHLSNIDKMLEDDDNG